jgi:hypothetical protein
MAVAALLAPVLISFVVKIGVKLAAKAVKSALDSADSAPSEPARKSFSAVLKDQENRLAGGSDAVTISAGGVSTPADPVGRLAHEQGVRSLALRVKTRLRLPLPPFPKDTGTAWPMGAGRLAAKSHLDASV